MAGLFGVFYSAQVGALGGLAMFVGLGFIVMLVATYGLFAWQLSMRRIVVLCIAGILLVAAQFLRIQKDGEATAQVKGDVYGR
jgi:hypothetical protein